MLRFSYLQARTKYDPIDILCGIEYIRKQLGLRAKHFWSRMSEVSVWRPQHSSPVIVKLSPKYSALVKNQKVKNMHQILHHDA